jgi:hypothetical protein
LRRNSGVSLFSALFSLLRVVDRAFSITSW